MMTDANNWGVAILVSVYKFYDSNHSQDRAMCTSLCSVHLAMLFRKVRDRFWILWLHVFDTSGRRSGS
jgi:hypothetical protein